MRTGIFDKWQFLRCLRKCQNLKVLVSLHVPRSISEVFDDFMLTIITSDCRNVETGRSLAGAFLRCRGKLKQDGTASGFRRFLGRDLEYGRNGG